MNKRVVTVSVFVVLYMNKRVVTVFL